MEQNNGLFNLDSAIQELNERCLIDRKTYSEWIKELDIKDISISNTEHLKDLKMSKMKFYWIINQSSHIPFTEK
jgi:hypothetical protein